MQGIDKDEYIAKAREPLLKLFGNEKPDPFSNPFLPNVESQMIIAGGVPKDNFLNAIKAVATELGDVGFYLHSPEPHLYQATYKYNWYIPFDDIDNFKDATLVDHFEYIYYSPQGLWGLVTSDVHGVLGGSKKFCQTICKMLPDLETDVLDFIHYWQRTKAEYPDRIDLSWLEPMLVSIYGNDQLSDLLDRASKLSN